MLVASACRGRAFCPSCEKKRQVLWAEWLREDVLTRTAHRHVVLTIPRPLRPLFRQRRELLTELGCAADGSWPPLPQWDDRRGTHRLSLASHR